MNAFSRRGACPALSAPMRTGDGLLVRVNPVASGLSPSQLKGLSEAAARHGNGLIEVTARGSLQIRGLTEASVAPLAAEVNALGIEVRTGVPVETGRLAGLDPQETADPTRLADAIRVTIAVAGLEGRLGPKVSVVVDGGGRSGMAGVAADVRLEAAGGAAWRLSVAGDSAGATALGLVAEGEAADAVVAILERVAALGRAARARDVPVGDHPLTGLPAISPHGGEKRQLPMVAAHIGGGDLPLTPKSLLNAPFPLRDGRHALGIALPFGQADSGAMIALAATAGAAGVEDLRFAPGRTILFLCPSPEAAGVVRAQAAALDFITQAGDPRLRVVACAGAPACASGHLPARAMAAAMAPLVPEETDLHVSGCAKGCAHPAPAALTVVGSEKGAGLVAGGTARDRALAYQQADGVAGALGRVARLVAAERRDGEDAAACLRRIGSDRLAAAYGEG